MLATSRCPRGTGSSMAPLPAPPCGPPGPCRPSALPGRARSPRRAATPRPPPPRRGTRGRAVGAAASGSAPGPAGWPAAWPDRAGPRRAGRGEQTKPRPSQAAAAATPPGAANGHSGAGSGRGGLARSPGEANAVAQPWEESCWDAPLCTQDYILVQRRKALGLLRNLP